MRQDQICSLFLVSFIMIEELWNTLLSYFTSFTYFMYKSSFIFWVNKFQCLWISISLKSCCPLDLCQAWSLLFLLEARKRKLLCLRASQGYFQWTSCFLRQCYPSFLTLPCDTILTFHLSIMFVPEMFFLWWSDISLCWVYSWVELAALKTVFSSYQNWQLQGKHFIDSNNISNVLITSSRVSW